MALSCLLILFSKLVSFLHLVGASLNHNRRAQFLQPYGYLPCPTHYFLCPMTQLELIKKLEISFNQKLKRMCYLHRNEKWQREHVSYLHSSWRSTGKAKLILAKNRIKIIFVTGIFDCCLAIVVCSSRCS